MPTIEQTAFGSITIDGVDYPHDVIIRRSGQIEKRKKKLSKALYGTSHILAEAEVRDLDLKHGDRLIIGSGQYGQVSLSPEAAAFLQALDCDVTLEPTPKALRTFNHSHVASIGLFHVTC